MLEAIAAGQLDGQLSLLADAIDARHHLLRTVRSGAVLAELRAGDRVRLSARISPQYLRGLQGTVVALDGRAVTVDLGGPLGRFHSGQVRCPPLVLERLAPPAAGAGDGTP